MMVFYLINTLVAMVIGLTLTNLIRPGMGAALSSPAPRRADLAKKTITDLAPGPDPDQRRRAIHPEPSGPTGRSDSAPGNRPGEDPRQQKARGETSFKVVVDLLTIGFELLMKVLLWVVALVPLAVFGIVAASVGQKEGMRVFASLHLADRRGCRSGWRCRWSGI